MAFRIHDSVVRGEIDNREKGVGRGRVWVHGRPEPLVLQLRGNAHPDLAGCLLPLDKFEWEKTFRESDALTDKVSQLYEKHGARLDFEDLLAREMGGSLPPDDEAQDPGPDPATSPQAASEADASAEEPDSLQPDPTTEGVHWVRDSSSRVNHPLGDPHPRRRADPAGATNAACSTKAATKTGA